MPVVTIGIPTYRRPVLVRRAIASALAQDHGEVEVVVSDNASGDETDAICREAAAADPRVRYLPQPVNLGPAPNFLAVLAAATGEYFMWLGDDDWIDRSYVSACLRLLRSSPEISVVGGIAHNYRGDEVLAPARAMDLTHADPSRRVVDYYRTVEENPIFYGVMRRDLVASCGLTNTLGGDWLLMAQLAFHGRLRTSPAALLHRERTTSTSRSVASMVQTLRLPKIQEAFPVSAIALAASRDVLAPDRVFATLSAPARCALAAAVAATLAVRLGVWFRARRVLTPMIGQDRARRWKAGVLSALAARRAPPRS